MKPCSFTHADVEAIVGRLEDQLGPARPTAIRLREGHSNLVAEIDFDSGRTLIVKQARYGEMTARFDTSRLAARLLRERTNVVVPEYFDVPDDDGVSTLAYWRIPLATLALLWPRVEAGSPRYTLHSWGALIRCIHQVRLPGHGALLDARAQTRSAAEFVEIDLRERLRPAVASLWPAALASVDELYGKAGVLKSHCGSAQAMLIHNDLFAANILCEQNSRAEVSCVGVIDFEDAFAGPPEAEFAKIEVLHGPLFGQPRGEGFVREIAAGYGAPLDPRVTAYSRALQLLNMGFHAAAIGLDAHAADVLDAIRAELGGID